MRAPIATFIAMGLASSLAACSSTDMSSFEPVAAASPVPVSVPSSGPTSTARTIAADPVAPSGALALAAPATVQSAPAVNAAIAATQLEIVPLTGAPSGAVAPLSRAMADRGREIGLPFAQRGGTHRLKGFFSVNDDGREVRVVYIWDVLDGSGRRVHRIRGQEVIPGSVNGSDPWSAVTRNAMERIGRDTIDRFADWRRA